MVALTDAIGKLIHFIILPGQSHNLMVMPALLDPVDFTTLIGDKAFDSDALLDTLAEHGVKTVIPPKRNRTLPRTFDRDIYRERHRIENFFCKIKEFRAITTRYDKTASRFAAGIYLIAEIIAAR
ncbi:MAG: transposase [Aestuariivita sp.]|nr:transposase [Aestuariivita sp.]